MSMACFWWQWKRGADLELKRQIEIQRNANALLPVECSSCHQTTWKRNDASDTMCDSCRTAIAGGGLPGVNPAAAGGAESQQFATTQLSDPMNQQVTFAEDLNKPQLPAFVPMQAQTFTSVDPQQTRSLRPVSQVVDGNTVTTTYQQ